jgi:predicted nucleic-acid-binding protein
MLAVDSNIIVRYLTGDDPDQSARAKALVERGDLFVSTTVLLETEWVLRTVYGYRAADLVEALRALAGLPGVMVEAPSQVAAAFDLASRGMDFADALHLSKAGNCEAFVTFDRRFTSLARRLATIEVRAP